ncbi:MAG: preprotein translocase subunit Sec61beta [Desulfurococcales archaeon]|nr:preprotein translocase subunit Sec61beta [Desulfurococcales archaeon]
MPSKKRSRRQGGPMTAAGLISFYDEYEEKVRLSPMTIVIISILYAVIVVLAHAIH